MCSARKAYFFCLHLHLWSQWPLQKVRSLSLLLQSGYFSVKEVWCSCVWYFYKKNKAIDASNMCIKAKFAWEAKNLRICSNRSLLQFGGVAHPHSFHPFTYTYMFVLSFLTHKPFFFFFQKHKLLSDWLILVTSMSKLCHSFFSLRCSKPSNAHIANWENYIKLHPRSKKEKWHNLLKNIKNY